MLKGQINFLLRIVKLKEKQINFNISLSCNIKLESNHSNQRVKVIKIRLFKIEQLKNQNGRER